MATAQKEKQVADLKDRFSRAASIVQVEYRGITAVNMDKLRSSLRKEDVEFKVIKNRLAKIAVKDTPAEGLGEKFSGPISVAIGYKDSIAPARLITEFAKVEKLLKIVGGMTEGEIYDGGQMKTLGSLPGKQSLQASLLSAMQGTPRNFVSVLGGVLRKFLYLLAALEELKNKNPDSIGGEEMADLTAEDVKNYLNGLSVL